MIECDFVFDLGEVQVVVTDVDFWVFVGVEVEVNQGWFIVIFMDLNQEKFKECVWLFEDGLFELKDVILFFNDVGGVVIVVYFYLDDGEVFLGDEVYNVEGLVVVEILCGVWGYFFNDWVLEVVVSFGLFNVGGSDIGFKGEWLGYFVMVFVDDIENQGQLVEVIRNGDVWVVEICFSDMDWGCGGG